MEATDLKRAGDYLFGSNWSEKMGRLFGIRSKTLRRMERGLQPVPHQIFHVLVTLAAGVLAADAYGQRRRCIADANLVDPRWSRDFDARVSSMADQILAASRGAPDLSAVTDRLILPPVANDHGDSAVGLSR